VCQPTAGTSPYDLAVFQQPWWLEIAKRGEDYREFVVRKCGKIVGSLGFVVATNKAGNRLGFPPIWAHLGGPVLDQSLNHIEKAEALRRLMVQLPRNISFKFVCSPDTADAGAIRQEFRRAGFECSSETTYLQYPDDKGILERLTGESRRQIASASKRLRVTDLGADDFIAFYEANLATAGKSSYASLQIARDLIVRGLEAEIPQVRVIAAKKMAGGAPLDAAIAYAWDSKRYYLWMVTHRCYSHGLHDKPHPHAGKLLILIGTEDARNRGLIFDADGATTDGNETLYRDRLKFPHVEFRDVFIRDTRLHKLYKQLKPRLRAQSARLKGWPWNTKHS
jgi:hypothetical protein